MTIEDIRTMRLARQKPAGVVTVVLGHIPKKLRSDALMVEIQPGANPSLMDLRPLVGVWVATIQIEGQEDALDQAVEALLKVGAKLFGFVREGKAETLCLFSDPHDKHKAQYALYNEWRNLCS